jgi:hypothetical protein
MQSLSFQSLGFQREPLLGLENLLAWGTSIGEVENATWDSCIGYRVLLLNAIRNSLFFWATSHGFDADKDFRQDSPFSFPLFPM